MSGSIGDNVFRASGVIAAAAAGRTGTVDWVTTVKVTGDSPITAVTGEGYFLNTTAGTITINLPAGAAGSIVSMADYARTWDSNNVTVAANGSEKIGGIAQDATLNTEGQSVTFVYIDSTQGWVNVQDSTSAVQGVPPYITATGGTPCSGAIVCTNYKVHTFTGPGTFCVTSGGAAAPCSGTGSNTVDYLVVAGGGGGGSNIPGAPDSGRGGGGGAGGYRESPGTANGSYTVSPRGAAPAVALPVTATPYTITVGGGGPEGIKLPGNPSTFSSITSTAGGGGGIGTTPACQKTGDAGGSGGGAATWTGAGSPGPGNNPPTNPVQGTDGGTATESSPAYGAGGGGGALCAGGGGTSAVGGDGGDGATSSINATPTVRAGGGGGSTQAATPTKGGAGSGGGGIGASVACSSAGTNATCNSGGGGGGGSGLLVGGNGGSGVVILRYKFQN